MIKLTVEERQKLMAAGVIGQRKEEPKRVQTVPKDDIDKMIQMGKEGYQGKDIATAMGYHPITIYRHMGKHGAYIWLTNEEIEKIREMRGKRK